MKVPKARRLPSGAYTVQLMINGERISITRATAKEAETEAQYQKAQAKAGKRPAQQKRVEMTVGEIMQSYVDRAKKKGRSPSTIEGYLGIRRNRFKEIQNVPFYKVKDWQDIIDAEGENYASKTVYNGWGMFASACRALKIPVPQVELPELEMAERPFLEPDQVSVFLEAIKGKPCEMGALLGLHSLRRSEALHLTRGQCDLEAGTMRVQGATLRVAGAYVERDKNKTKGSRRTVPIMSDRLRELIAEIDDPAEKLVKLTPWTLVYQINKVCDDAGLPRVGNHGLRSTFTEMAYDRGVPEWATMTMGGWSNAQTVHKHYAHFETLRAERYGEKMQGFFNGNGQ